MPKNERKIGVILSYAVIIFNILIQLAYTPALVRFLGPSEYGLYSLIASIIGYLSVLDLGFGNAMIVYSSKYIAQGKKEEENKLYGMFKKIYFIIGIIATILGVILYLNVENMFGTTMTDTEISKAKIMMLILTFNLAITFTFSIYNSIISSHEKFIYQKVAALISIILKPLIMLPLLLFGFKSITLTIVLTLINLAIVISNYIFCRRKLNIKINSTSIDKKVFKEIFSYSIFIFLGVIVDKINWSVDSAILGAVSGTVAVAVYSVAAQLNALFINLSTAISGVLLPKMSKMIAEKSSNEEITKEFIKVGRIQFIMIFFMASCLVLFGKEFINWWVGNEYQDAYYIAMILILPLCIPLIQNLGLSIMQAMNKHKFRSIMCAFIAIINIIISIPLAQKYGGIGSAIGTAMSLFVGNIIIMNIYYHKKIGINIIKFWKEIIIMLSKCIIPIIIIMLIMYMSNLTGFISLVVYGLLYSLIYIFITYKLVANNYEKSLINNVLHKFKIKK